MDPIELDEFDRRLCGLAPEDGRSGVRRRFDVGGVMSPERKDWVEAGAFREGV